MWVLWLSLTLTMMAGGVETPDDPSALLADCRRVVVIHFDTTRVDDFGCYAGKVRTPNVDAIAAQGMRYTNSICTFPTTASSVATFMTGQLTVNHRVYQNTRGLFDEQVSFVELLQAKGFATCAFVSNEMLFARGPRGHSKGFSKGFDVYKKLVEKHPLEPGQSKMDIPHPHADGVVEAARDFVRAHAEERFFLWLLHFDPHAPYHPPEPYYSMYENDPELIANSVQLDPDVVHWARPNPPLASHKHIARHRGAVTYADESMTELLAEIAALPGKTLYIITADHGESLGDEDYWFHHGNNIRWPSMEVPFIIACDGVIPAGTCDALVANTDLGLTILELLGIDASTMQTDGRSLVPTLQGENPWPERMVAMEAVPSMVEHWNRHMMVGKAIEWYGVRGKDYTLHRSYLFGTHEPKSARLYRREDRHEAVNVITEEREAADRYTAFMEKVFKDVAPPDTVDSDEEMRSLLKSLGYLE
jgi:arylsulfatase A-like enzyme